MAAYFDLQGASRKMLSSKVSSHAHGSSMLQLLRARAESCEKLGSYGKQVSTGSSKNTRNSCIHPLGIEPRILEEHGAAAMKQVSDFLPT